MNRKTPQSCKTSQPQPLKVVHPSPQIDAPPSSTTETKNETTIPSTMHARNKRQNTTPKGDSSSRPTKRLKITDPNSAEEISNEMSVGFSLDEYWYDSTLFPQLHAILQNHD